MCFNGDGKMPHHKLQGSTLTDRIQSELELLERHVMLLKVIMKEQPIGIIRLSENSGFPQHKVRYSLRILEQEGLILPSPDGAMATEKLESYLPILRKILKQIGEKSKELQKSIG
jgi:predicted transcriptional regulator